VRNAGLVGNWVIVGDSLCVQSADGSRYCPSADVIYRFAVEQQEVAGLPSVHQGAAADLSFSRFPLTLELRIETVPHAGPYGLKAIVYAIGPGVSVQVNNAIGRESDHTVVDGRWYPLAAGCLDDMRKVLREAGIDSDSFITLRQYISLKVVAAKRPEIRDVSNGAMSANRQHADETGDVPPAFNGTLYPYQKNGLKWLRLLLSQQLGGILADEMGLGKTVQIAALLAGESQPGKKPSLVIATGTLLENWRRELERFAPGLKTLVHRGAKRTGVPGELAACDVVISSYDTVIRDLSLFRQIDWNVVVLDEAQAIKNADSKRALAVKRLPRRHALAVTGTPMENRLSDLWSIADFSLPGLLGDRQRFEQQFSNDEQGAEALEPLLSPILLRRRVADVANDLPPRIDIPQALELTEKQAQAYEEIRRSTIAEYGGSATIVALTHLRMFCAHPALVGAEYDDLLQASPKYERLTEILEEILARGERAIIFTSYNAMTDLLVSDLSRRFAIPLFYIDGRVPIDDRQATVDRFSAVASGAVLVLNPRAAGTGLNVTAANHVIHYNLEWNPAVEDQASARAHRRGQTRPVTVHRLFFVGTVEEVMDDRLRFKRSLAGKAVVGTDGSETDLADIAIALAKSPVRRG